LAGSQACLLKKSEVLAESDIKLDWSAVHHKIKASAQNMSDMSERKVTKPFRGAHAPRLGEGCQ
ncbi:MAG: hypothetical protein ACE5ET_11430, partial [Gammaproteobacteria bacterium]